MRRVVAIAGLFVGLFALVAQFAIMIPASLADGRDIVSAIVYYFSFFTILTNILVVLVYFGALMGEKGWLAFFDTPIARATAAATITLVGTYYHFVLSGIYEEEGLLGVCVVLMHYVLPVLYLVWFAVWNRTGTLKWAAIPAMLVYPLVYLIFILLRGAMTGEYPYDIFDAGTFGYAQVALNALGLLAILIVLNAVAVGVDRFFSRRQTQLT